MFGHTPEEFQALMDDAMAKLPIEVQYTPAMYDLPAFLGGIARYLITEEPELANDRDELVKRVAQQFEIAQEGDPLERLIHEGLRSELDPIPFRNYISEQRAIAWRALDAIKRHHAHPEQASYAGLRNKAGTFNVLVDLFSQHLFDLLCDGAPADDDLLSQYNAYQEVAKSGGKDTDHLANWLDEIVEHLRIEDETFLAAYNGYQENPNDQAYDEMVAYVEDEISQMFADGMDKDYAQGAINRLVDRAH